jgi:hypothetical protein
VTFDKAYNLRTAEDLQPLRYAGLCKNAAYSYPKSIVWDGFLYVAYGTDKEDVQLSRVPVDLARRGCPSHRPGWHGPCR